MAVSAEGGDDKHHIYLAGDGDLAIFDIEGRQISRWGTDRPGHALAVSPDGSIFVGEAGQLEIFTPYGLLSGALVDPERLGLVTAVGFVGTEILCADATARCIRRFDAEGSFLNDIGHDSRRRGFIIPNGALDFAVDSEGNLQVANPGMHRIQRYTPEGVLLGHFGRFDGLDPEGFGGCCNPTNIALTHEGHIVVSEKAEPRVKTYTRDGSLLAVVATEAFDLGCKNMDLATDTEGRIFAIDTVALDLCVFEELDHGR